MNRLLLRRSLFVTVIMLAGSAFADPAQASSRIQYGQVLRADPIIDVVRIAEPHQVCWDEQVSYRQPRSRSRTPDLLGAIIGGAIGNQIGDGSGRTAATVAGVALGASIGRDHARRHHSNEVRYGYGYEQRCRTENRYREEQRILGYDVTYRYRGEVYQTRTQHDPGQRIALEVSVRPAR